MLQYYFGPDLGLSADLLVPWKLALSRAWPHIPPPQRCSPTPLPPPTPSPHPRTSWCSTSSPLFGCRPSRCHWRSRGGLDAETLGHCGAEVGVSDQSCNSPPIPCANKLGLCSQPGECGQPGLGNSLQLLFQVWNANYWFYHLSVEGVVFRAGWSPDVWRWRRFMMSGGRKCYQVVKLSQVQKKFVSTGIVRDLNNLSFFLISRCKICPKICSLLCSYSLTPYISSLDTAEEVWTDKNQKLIVNLLVDCVYIMQSFFPLSNTRNLIDYLVLERQKV